jgi:hypothetical protein
VVSNRVHVEHVGSDRHRELRRLAQHVAQLAEHRQRQLAQHQPVDGQLADLEQPQAQPVPPGPGALQHAAGGQRGQHPAGGALGHPELAGHPGRAQLGRGLEAAEHAHGDGHRAQLTVALVRDQLRDVRGERHRVEDRLVEIRDRHDSQAGNSSGGGTFTSVTRFR